MMMSFVVVASITAIWFLPDERISQAALAEGVEIVGPLAPSAMVPAARDG